MDTNITSTQRRNSVLHSNTASNSKIKGKLNKEDCSSNTVKKQNKLPCKNCSNIINDQTDLITCNPCESWFNIKCSKLTAKEYAIICKIKGLQWICNICSKLGSENENNYTIEERRNTSWELINKINKLEEKIKKIETKLENILKNQLENNTSTSVSLHPPNQELNILSRNNLTNTNTSYDYKYNLRIIGLQEPNTNNYWENRKQDTNKIIELIESLGCNRWPN